MKNLSNQLNIRLLSVILIAAGMVIMLLLSFSLDATAGSLIPPQIVEIYPQNGSHDAEVTTFIAATYDQDMDPASVNPKSFVVHARQTGWLTETLSVDGATIMLQPSKPLHAGELVQVSATTANLSMDGEAPIEPTVWEFTTSPWGGNAYFRENQILPNTGGRYTALGDLDWDGDLDAVTVSCGGTTRVYSNDSTGIFTESQSFGHTAFCLLDVDLGDLDSDGDLDAFLTNYVYGMNLILENNGEGYFTVQDATPSQMDCYTGLGDLDGDGDLDLLTTSGGFSTGYLRQWENDGSGNFSLVATFDSSYQHTGVALGDLDNDGDLDAFTTGWFNTFNKVWINDGGIFSEGQVIAGANTYYPVLGDLNNDSYLDVYLSNNQYPTDYPDEVWFNDGTGHFIDSGQSLETPNAAIPALGDLDADGDLDVYTSGGWETPLPDEVWANDGTGTFTLFRTLDEDNAGGMVVLGDLEGDGSLDAFVTSQIMEDGYQVYLNGDWTQAAPIPHITTGAAPISCPDDPNVFYILGGMDGWNSYLNELRKYDASIDEWEDLGEFPYPALNASTAACYGGKIYAAYDWEFYIYNITLKSWEEGPVPPRFIEGGILGAWDGSLYMMGGIDDDYMGPLDERIFRYDIVSGAWQADPVGSMPTPVYNAGWEQIGPYLYVTGGEQYGNPDIDVTYRYDMSSNTWEQGPDLPSARAYTGLVATSTRLYVLGGAYDLTDFYDDVYYQELATWPNDAWADFNDPLLVAMGGMATACTEAVSGGEIWSTGGSHMVGGVHVYDTNLYHPTGEPCVSFGVDLPEPMQGEGAAGETVTYTLFVTNTGVVTDYYTLDVTSTWDFTAPVDDIGPLGPGESTQIQISVDIPAEAVWGNQGLTEVVVASISNPAATDTTTITTTSTTIWTRIFIPLVMKN